MFKKNRNENAGIIFFSALIIGLSGCTTQAPKPAPVIVTAPVVAQKPQARPNEVTFRFSEKITLEGVVFIDSQRVGTVSPGDEHFTTIIKLNEWEPTRCILFEVRFRASQPFRCAQFATLERTEKLQSVNVSVVSFPVIDVVVNPAKPMSEPVVYAGDKVKLMACGRVSSSGFRYFWTVFSDPDIRRLVPASIDTLKGGSKLYGMTSWLSLRDAISKEINAALSQDGHTINGIEDLAVDKLFASMENSVYLGEGHSVDFQPRQEGRVVACLMTYDGQGHWQLSFRDFLVLDVRPVVWMLPQLPIRDQASIRALEELRARIAEFGASDIRIYSDIVKALSHANFSATVGHPVNIAISRGAQWRAEVPLESATIQVNDGRKQVVNLNDDGAGRFTFNPEAQGEYRLRMIARDVMGLEREANLIIQASSPPKQPALASSPAKQPAREPVMKAEATRKPGQPTAFVVENSRDLFRLVVNEWAEKTTRLVYDYTGKKLGISHLHDHANRDVIDLLDHVLVGNLLDQGHMVIERDNVWLNSLVVNQLSHRDALIHRDLTNFSPQNSADLEALMNLSSSMSLPAHNSVETLLHYKLKRAGVFYETLGPLTLQRAAISAFVRLHDGANYQILAQDEVSAEIAHLIIDASGTPLRDHRPWDSYPPNFMTAHASILPDVATASVRVKSSDRLGGTQSAPPDVPESAKSPAAGAAEAVSGALQRLNPFAGK